MEMSRLANIKIKTIIFLTLIAYAQYHEVGALNADNSQESNAPKQTIPGIVRHLNFRTFLMFNKTDISIIYINI